MEGVEISPQSDILYINISSILTFHQVKPDIPDVPAYIYVYPGELESTPFVLINKLH